MPRFNVKTLTVVKVMVNHFTDIREFVDWKLVEIQRKDSLRWKHQHYPGVCDHDVTLKQSKCRGMLPYKSGYWQQHSSIWLCTEKQVILLSE
ncbi:hypothetical protein LSH36_435g00008, partial [Paralvinella palmiformis]